MQLFNFSLQIKGFKINKAKALLSDILKKNDAEFKAYVSAKKKEIVRYHLNNNSFYKQKGKSIDIDDWNTIPIITKKDLQQPLKTLLSDSFAKRDVYIDKTSGASGDPFIFAKNKFSHALTWAVIMNRFSWYNIDINTSKQARFYGIPLDKKGYYKERVKDFLANRYRFSVFDLSDDAFEKCIEKFKNTSFDYINGYTSPIVQFAKYLKHKNLILKDICPSLKVCMTTSEMLFDDDRLLLEEHFGVPIVNEYGASELDLIAFQNTNKEWQVNSETLFVEVLDENNNVLEYGQEGRLVITSLYNKASPFIRYDIGDIGVLSKKSTIRKPILEKLIGRTNDIAILPSGKKAAGLTFYYITKSIIEDDGQVKEFIIEQLSLRNFRVSYVSKVILSKAKKDIITKSMETYLEKGISVSFEKHEKLTRSKSGKLKQFTSHINL